MANLAATCRRLVDYVAIRSAGQAALTLAAVAAFAGIGVWWFANGGSENLTPLNSPRARAAAGFSGSPQSPAPRAPSATTTGQGVNINTADADELIQLPNIGPKIAQNIIDYRTSHGPFETIEELDNVPQIGVKRLEALRPLVRVK